MAAPVSALVVVIPTRGRAGVLSSVAESFRATSPCRVLFVCDPDDLESHEAARRAGSLVVTPERRGYPAKANFGIDHSSEPLLLIGADDVRPHPGWYEAASARISKEIGFVSVNDLGNEAVMAGEYAVLPLVARWYVELGTIDGQPGLFHEGYWHNPADLEASATAKRRGAFAYAPDAIVEHLHPNYGKSEVDQTYLDGGMNQEANERDHILFAERQELWT